MDKVKLWVRTPNVHELLVHKVAELADLYGPRDLEFELIDGVGKDQGRPDMDITIGMGDALLSRLTRRIPWRTTIVYNHYPLFWLYTRNSVTLKDLGGRTVITRPAYCGATAFLMVALRRRGLERDRDYKLEEHVTDAEIYGRLLDDQPDAVMLGTGVCPYRLPEDGYQSAMFLGSEVPWSATGLAVKPSFPTALLGPLVATHQAALKVVHANEDLAVEAIMALESAWSHEHSVRFYHEYIQPYFTADGWPQPELVAPTLRDVAGLLNLQPGSEPSVDDIFDTRWL